MLSRSNAAMSPPVTVRTDDNALRDLSAQALLSDPCAAVPADVELLPSADVMEVENVGVGFAAIDAPAPLRFGDDGPELARVGALLLALADRIPTAPIRLLASQPCESTRWMVASAWVGILEREVAFAAGAHGESV